MSGDLSQKENLLAENELGAKEKETIRRENARVGYQAAIDIWTYEGEVIWARTNIMLLANSIILATVGLVLISQHPLFVLVISLSIVGVMLCIIWFLTIKRAFEYQQFWILSARELEEQYLSDPVQTLFRGGSFGKGHSIPINIDGSLQNLRISKLSRTFKQKWSNYTIISVFVLVYIIFLLQVV